METKELPRTIRSIRWFQPVARRRWCSEESIVVVSWWKNYSDGWPEVRASRSVISQEREREGRAVEDITRRRVRYTRAGLRGKIMPEEVGICLFSPLSLMTASTNDCVFVSFREPRKEGRQSSRKAYLFCFLWGAMRRSWSWLKCRPKLCKLRASEIENIVYSEQVSSYLNRKSRSPSAYFMLFLCVCFIKKNYFILFLTLSYFFICFINWFNNQLILLKYFWQLLFLTTRKIREVLIYKSNSCWRLKTRDISLWAISLIYFGSYIHAILSKRNVNMDPLFYKKKKIIIKELR